MVSKVISILMLSTVLGSQATAQDPANPHQGHEDKKKEQSAKEEHSKKEEHMEKKGPLGIPHTRMSSGTSWQPDSTPMHAIHLMVDDWNLMFHGNAFVGFDKQSDRRGEDAWVSMNWLMAMATKSIGESELSFRGMFSLEPATVGRDGYPLLFQTGESIGNQPLVDSQHPHDLFMELAAIYTTPLNEDFGLQLYAAPAGEPALGPSAFPHRMSAFSNPLAPLGHHWQDATHISFGVLTAGVFNRFAKLEGSWFNGREPDENRWDLDMRTPDSGSMRLTVNPNEFWSAQVSYGHLASPESLNPDASVNRTTASVIYNTPLGKDGNWATTAVWGRNDEEGDEPTNSFLIETDLAVDRHHTPFARFEYVRKSGDDLVLTPPFDAQHFGITSATLGYLYNFEPQGSIIPSIGIAASVGFINSDLESFYGSSNPYGFMVFFRLAPDQM